MSRLPSLIIVTMILLAGIAAFSSGKNNATIPSPVVDATKIGTSGQESVVFAGGCFWVSRLCFSMLRA
ncbi:MAG TPA: hypothetical protein VFA74_15845 [Terriglobales bacterium]|nr:hypothetical protein [Terriglobales bacterium]